jgi:PAS domain S-box-containing protein
MSDRELQSILDNSPAVIYVKDISGHFLRVNRRFEEIFGLDRSQIVGKTNHELFNKEIADRFHANDLQVIEAGHPIEFEETALLQDGPHDYISVKFPLHDDAGAVYASAGISTDITERKRSEEKIRESEQLFRSIFENAQIGISVFNVPAGQFHTNEALHEMLGCTHEDLSSVEKWDLIVHPDDRASGAERYAQLFEGQRNVDEFTQRFIRRDGEIVTASGRFTMIRDGEGKPKYIIALHEDITERVKAETELREAHETLARQLLAINQELEMARQIQLAILPSDTPRIHGLDISARYIPMSAVAGDFYDFIVIDDKHVGILIADVSGHGLPSALVASMLQSALAAQSMHASNPAQVLSGLNRALCNKFRSHFVTAAYLFLDMKDGIAKYAGAGHPPLLHRHKMSGGATELEENGFPLGVSCDARYSATTVTLEPGDRILLYTDGIVEAQNPSGDEFGMKRLTSILEETSAFTTCQVADAVLHQIARWTEQSPGEGQADDITLLAVDVTRLKPWLRSEKRAVRSASRANGSGRALMATSRPSLGSRAR